MRGYVLLFLCSPTGLCFFHVPYIAKEERKFCLRKSCAVSKDDVNRLEALVRGDDDADVEGHLPVVQVEKWTYFPGVREVLRVHAPAFTYIMSDVILQGNSGRYVHILKNNTIGVEMAVLDVIRDRDEMFALVHCLRRVRILKDVQKSKLRRYALIEPVLDNEEIFAAAGDLFLANQEASIWQAYDDPINDFSPTWLRDGGLGSQRHYFVSEQPLPLSFPQDDQETESLESRLWQELDRFVQLVRTSRTSGQFDLPPLLTMLRNSTVLPSHRRRLRLSFALPESLLDPNDRGLTRQLFLDCSSTADRLQLIIDRLIHDNNQLASALRLEAIRRDSYNS